MNSMIASIVDIVVGYLILIWKMSGSGSIIWFEIPIARIHSIIITIITISSVVTLLVGNMNMIITPVRVIISVTIVVVVVPFSSFFVGFSSLWPSSVVFVLLLIIFRTTKCPIGIVSLAVFIAALHNHIINTHWMWNIAIIITTSIAVIVSSMYRSIIFISTSNESGARWIAS